jgi:hypothetical protein
MDVFDIKPGTPWRKAIENAVRNCDVFLAMVSLHSIDRPGVLQGEIKEALDLWEERLDRDAYLVPVRLEEVDLPERLSHIQSVDLFAPEGPDRLREALRLGLASSRRHTFRRAVIVIVLAAAILAGLLFTWSLGRYRRDAEALASARPGAQRVVAGPPRFGLTLWRTQAGARASSRCSELNLRRAALDEPLRPNDAIRLGFEASRPGHLYVFNREVAKAGPGEWYLIFPTTRIRGGRNDVEPGTLIEIPPDDSLCATFALETQAGAAGEKVAFLLSDRPIEQLPPRDSDYEVDPAVLERLRRRALEPSGSSKSVEGVGQPRTAAEDEASAQWTRRLRYHEALPQTILTFADDKGRPLFAEVTLSVGGGPASPRK